jgi:hypothetical protein
MKSFKTKDNPGGDGPDGGRNAERDFRGEKRSNETHASITDPDARLYKKAAGQPSRLCFVGTALMENRNGLVVDGRLTRASGVSECLSAVDLADAHIRQGGTLAGDKGFDTADVVAELRDRPPHVAQNTYHTGKAKRRSNIDGRTIRHTGYAASQKCHKRIEEIFGWLKGMLAEVAVQRLGQYRARLPPGPRRLQPRPNAQAPRRRGRMMTKHEAQNQARRGTERRPEHAAGPTGTLSQLSRRRGPMSSAYDPHSRATPDASPMPFSAAC